MCVRVELEVKELGWPIGNCVDSETDLRSPFSGGDVNTAVCVFVCVCV